MNNSRQPVQSSSRMKPLTTFGIWISGIWIVSMGAYAYDRGLVAILEPNEFGDFLAGAFAPLAFLWLVLGYYQNSQALLAQQEELKNQVAETRRLAAVAEKRIPGDAQ